MRLRLRRVLRTDERIKPTDIGSGHNRGTHRRTIRTMGARRPRGRGYARGSRKECGSRHLLIFQECLERQRGFADADAAPLRRNGAGVSQRIAPQFDELLHAAVPFTRRRTTCRSCLRVVAWTSGRILSSARTIAPRFPADRASAVPAIELMPRYPERGRSNTTSRKLQPTGRSTRNDA